MSAKPMKGMQRLLSVILLIGAWGCQEARPSVKPSPKTVFVLLDLSQSTEPDRDSYLEGIDMILEAMGVGDTLVVEKINDNPLSRSSFPIKHIFRQTFSSKANNDRYRAAEQAKARADIEKQRSDLKLRCRSILQADSSKLTDIFGSLTLAQRVFGGYPSEIRIIALFSDMIHEAPPYDFRKLELGPEQRERIIAEEERLGRLPALSGARVYIAGANAAGTARFQALRAFWQDYLSACGATLADYGRSLIKFEEGT